MFNTRQHTSPTPKIALFVAILFSTSAFGATHYVTNTNASGPGSLAAAYAASVWGDTIGFNIPETDPNHYYYPDNGTSGVGTPAVTTVSDPVGADTDWPYSWYRITISSPTVFLSGRTLDGYTQPGAVVNTNPSPQPLNSILRVEIQINNGSQQFINNFNRVTLQGVNFNGTGSGNMFYYYASNHNTVYGVHMKGCYFGTDISGSKDNTSFTGLLHFQRWTDDGQFGLSGTPNPCRIGGSLPYERNILGGTTYAIQVNLQATWKQHFLQVEGNYIGVNRDGTGSVGNSYGFYYWRGNGNGSTIKDNVISGNSAAGINNRQSNLTVQGNIFGTDYTTTMSIPNGNGFQNDVSPTGVLIGGINPGEGNVFANNSSNGIYLSHSGGGHDNAILGNRFFGNGNRAIRNHGSSTGIVGTTDHCDPDATNAVSNEYQNKPVITSAEFDGLELVIQGTLNSVPNEDYRLEFFENTSATSGAYDVHSGEGEHYIGHTYVSTPGGCIVNFTTSFPYAPSSGSKISATATEATTASEATAVHGSTSVFSLSTDVSIDIDTICVMAELDSFVIDAIADADMYVWSTAGGATVNSVSGDTCVTVDWTSSSFANQFDTLYVVASNSCFADTTAYVIYLQICGEPDVFAINDINVSLDGLPVDGNVLTNDFHTSEDTFMINMSGTMNPSNGTLVLSSNGDYTYQPDSGFIGQDQFAYVICDTLTPTNCDTGYVVIQVTDGDDMVNNDTPIANDDAYVGFQNGSVSGLVLNNDMDPDGDPLSMTAVNISNLAGGTLAVNANGSFTYTPVAMFTGQVSFTYAACDTGSPMLCDTALVVIDILPSNPLNNPPFAADDAVMGMDTIEGTLLPNDSDPEGSPLVINPVPITGVSNGQLSINSDGDFVYVPDEGFTGTDYFIYEICDTNNPAGCAQATAYIVVLPEQICINTRVFLEGTFVDAGDSMTTWLNFFCSVLPTSHPYNVLPWNYNGTEVVNSMPSGVVDWVLVSLRNGIYLDSTQVMQAALLYGDGQIRTVDGGEVICYDIRPGDSIYVVVEHRNHVAAMSPTPIVNSSDAPIVVDFRYSESFKVGGVGLSSAGQKIVGTTDIGGADIYALYAGDPHKESGGKNDVNSNDIAPLLTAIGQFGTYTTGDHNLDCDHNSNDLPYVLNNLAKTSVVE